MEEDLPQAVPSLTGSPGLNKKGSWAECGGEPESSISPWALPQFQPQGSCLERLPWLPSVIQDEINPFLPKCYTKQQKAYKDTFKQKEKEIKKFTSGTCRIPVKFRAHHYISAGWEGTFTDIIKTIFFPTLQCNGSTPSSSSAMCAGSCTHPLAKIHKNVTLGSTTGEAVLQKS